MKTSRFLFVVVVGILISGLGHETVAASNANWWSPDEKAPGYLDDTFTPFLLADQNRTVHAFASQWVDDVYRRKAIVYRQWSLKGGWTRPVDVILAPKADANFLSAYLDNEGIIHIVYTVGDAENLVVYYSYVSAVNADVVQAWSLPMIVGWNASGVNSGAITGDGKGNLVILYSGFGDGNGVYAINSYNSGQSWSDAKPIFRTNDSKLIPLSIKTYVSESNRLHAVWAVSTSLGGYDSVYYAGLNIGTDQWDAYILLEKKPDAEGFFGPSYPTVVDNGTYVVVMYNSGNPFTGRPVDYGRPIIRVRFSRDNGKSWAEAVDPFPFLVGNSGEHSMVLDSNNVVHALVIMRIDSIVDGQYSAIGGVWYSELVGSIWSNPDRFVTSIIPVNIRAVVSQGNVILATWYEDPGAGQDGVWFSHTILDTPELSVIPLPTVVTVSTLPTETIPPQNIVAPIATKMVVATNQQETPPSPIMPFIIGLVPVVLLIFGVIIFYQSNKMARH